MDCGSKATKLKYGYFPKVFSEREAPRRDFSKAGQALCMLSCRINYVQGRTMTAA